MLIHSVYQNTWTFFCSLRLTVAVLALLLLGSIFGMFWDQTLTVAQHVESLRNAPITSTFFSIFELYDVYHSWWFSVVVLLLALNLIACSIERLPKIWIQIRNPDRDLTDRYAAKFQNIFSRILSSKPEALATIRQVFDEKCYESAVGNDVYYYSDKHKYGRLGVYVVHIALLMIMFGSILTTNFGVSGMLLIEEGTSNNIIQAKGPGGLTYNHKLDFSVACPDFRLKTFVDGSPMDYESDLQIFSGLISAPVSEKTIRVNEPLSYAGYTFYQSTYSELPGEENVSISIGPHGGNRLIYHAKIGERIEMKDKTVFIPLSVVSDYGGLGPALKIQQIEIGGETTSFYVFRYYPDFDPLVRRGNWDVFFQGFDHKYITGISAAKMPFLPVVFAGFIVIFVGLCMAFFMNYRQYYGRLRALQSGQWEVTIAGTARRHKPIFSDEFNAMVERLR